MTGHITSRIQPGHLIILLLLGLTLFFFRLGSRPLWDTDEGMHAATSKDMVLTGDWVVPQFNGEPFYDKPVLYNWVMAVLFLVLGFTEFAARLRDERRFEGPEALMAQIRDDVSGALVVMAASPGKGV